MPSNEQQVVGAVAVALEGADLDTGRTTMIVENNSAAAQVIFIDTRSDVSIVKGIRIVAGGNIVMERALGWPTSMKWYVVASAAGALVNVYEGYPDPSLPPGQQGGGPGGGGGGNGNGGGDPPDPPPMSGQGAWDP